MKRTIWKYNITPEKNKLSIPQNSQILTVQTQNGEPKLWVLVYPDNEIEERTFVGYATGQSMPLFPGEYIGTFQVEDNTSVFHLFEEK